MRLDKSLFADENIVFTGTMALIGMAGVGGLVVALVAFVVYKLFA